MADDYIVGLRYRSDSREIQKSDKDVQHLEKSTDRARRSADRLGRAFGRAIGGISAALVFRSIIQNTIAQEKAVTQLNAALRSTGRYSDETSAALQKQAAALQNVTTYGDEAVIGAQALLLTFKQIGGDVFPRATEAVLDMSYAMGQDLKSTVVQLGKALNDPIVGITALARVGVTFSESQKKVIKELAETGRLAEAQALILDELESEFGGSARAARDTFGGALQAVKNRIGDLLEAKGDSLTALIATLNQLEETLASPAMQRGFQNLTRGATNLVGVGAEALSELGGLGDQLAANFAAISGNLLDEDRIQQEINAIDRALSATTFLGKPLKYLGTSRDELEALRKEYEALLAKAQATDFGLEPPKMPALNLDVIGGELDPIEVTTKRKDDSDDYLGALKRRHQEAVESAEALRTTLNALAAEMGGPVVEASTALADTMAQLDEYQTKLAADGQLTLEKEQQIASARALATQQYEQRLEQIEREAELERSKLTQSQELLEQLRLEVELIGLSNVEREKRLALQMAGADATAEEIAEIERLVEQKARLEETSRVINTVRDSAVDAFTAWATGSRSASDAFKAFSDRIIEEGMRLLAEKALQALFGGGGGMGGFGATSGNGGGLFGTIFASIFGPGRALGGPVYPGRVHPVNEKGQPELLTVGNKQFLITGQQTGLVQPVSNTNNTTNHRNIQMQVNIEAPRNRQNDSQLAKYLMKEQRRQLGRA